MPLETLAARALLPLCMLLSRNRPESTKVLSPQRQGWPNKDSLFLAGS